MNITLNGFFDKNFGDDVMHRMIVKSFPEHDFYVSSREREMFSHLEGLGNVHINEDIPAQGILLNVIGTGFMYRGKRAKAEKIFSMFTSHKKHYQKSALINCSLETFDSKTGERFARYDLKEYDFITCRDDKTYKYLTDSFKNKEINLISDMVFASGLEKTIANTGEGLLGVAPVRRLYTDGNYEYYKELAEFCDAYVEQHNKKVLLFAFDSGMENDICAALSIRAMMNRKDSAEIVMYDGDIDAFASAMGRCGVFVTSRFHGLVLSLLGGVPCVAVSDREKLNRLCTKYTVPFIGKSEVTSEKLKKLVSECKLTVDKSDFADAVLHIEKLKQFISE